MYLIKKLMITATFIATTSALALPYFHPEAAPPPNVGAIRTEELGPVFSRPLSEEESVPLPPKAPKQKKKDILSLFQDDSKPKKEEVNPLEDMAKKEMKALQDPENQTAENQAAEDQSPVVQLGENKKSTKPINPQKVPKEIDL